jgi:hypothetical protein
MYVNDVVLTGFTNIVHHCTRVMNSTQLREREQGKDPDMQGRIVPTYQVLVTSSPVTISLAIKIEAGGYVLLMNY